jgi:anti-sigma factor RsiW
MSCTGDGARRELQINAYLDGELDLTSALELEDHLARCPDCARSLAARRALGEAIAAADLRFRPAPEQVRRLRRRLASGARAHAEDEIRRPVWTGAWLAGPRLRALAALLLVAVASWSLGRRWPVRPEGAGGAGGREARQGGRAAVAGQGALAGGEAADLTEQVLAGHVRALLSGRPEDVPSSDRHTVKPWFAGRLDYSPPVVDLAAAGFPLRGGRLDYAGGRPVAALVYQAGNHLVSVFVWPAGDSPPGAGTPASGAGTPARGGGTTAPGAGTPATGPGPDDGGAAVASSRRGFNQLRWVQAGMAWWAVSDVAADRLAELVRRLRAELPAAPASEGDRGAGASPPPGRRE